MKITAREMILYEKRYGDKNWVKNDPKRIERLADRMSLLDKDEKELVLNLTDKFCLFEGPVIMFGLQTAFEDLVDKNIVGKLLIAPLKSPFVKPQLDKAGRILANKSKSGDIYYQIFSRMFVSSKYSGIVIKFCDTPTDLKKALEDGNARIILVDDFVGTGLTAINNINSYLSYLDGENINANARDFSILAFAAMQQGMKKLFDEMGVRTFCKEVLTKGISDDRKLNNEKNKNMMQSIEKKVLPALKPEFSFGLHGSEALLSIMEKAPNNTFPFYWGNQGTTLEPIFRRNH